MHISTNYACTTTKICLENVRVTNTTLTYQLCVPGLPESPVIIVINITIIKLNWPTCYGQLGTHLQVLFSKYSSVYTVFQCLYSIPMFIQYSSVYSNVYTGSIHKLFEEPNRQA